MADSKLARSKFDGDSDDDAPPAKKQRASGKRRGNGVPMLQAPLWKPTSLRKTADKLDNATIEFVLSSVLKNYPVVCRYRLFEAICSDATRNANRVYKDNHQDFDNTYEKLKTKVQKIAYVDTPTTTTIVLATMLGATTIDPTHVDVLNDETLMNDEEGTEMIPPTSRRLPEFVALSTVPKFQAGDRGSVVCYCGSPAAFTSRKGFGNAPPSQWFKCAEGRCRLQITPSGLMLLNTLMKEHALERIPVWYCPIHPDQCMAITEEKLKDRDGDFTGDSKLKIRCTYYNSKASSEGRFCINQYLGPDGMTHQTTGIPVWKAMDLLTR